ncbi:MAG: type I-F CRISPR-associated protein Csy1 [Rhodanobacteraceae bacterium]
MSDLTDRGELFRAAIGAFVGTKLKKLPKDEHGNFASATETECDAWLTKAIQFVPKLHAATHVLKATHGDAAGSDVLVSPSDAIQRHEIGTHTVGPSLEIDIVASSAAYLGASSFYRAEAGGRRFAEWINAGDTDFCAALYPDAETAKSWMLALQQLGTPYNDPTTHPMAKQIYWLAGEDPHDDGQYHLLQPMFASSLAHAVHADIQNARFGETNKAARQAKRDNKPSGTIYHDHRGLVARKLGGTKPQNISQLNSERGGVNYLLASLPPAAWKPGSGVNLLKLNSVFDEKRSALHWFGGMRDLLRTLTDFLKTNPDPTMDTRNHRETIEQAIGQELAMFGVAIRGHHTVGWTRDESCSLPLYEQVWLDPDRTELAVRDAADHPRWKSDDLAFNDAYALGDWADEVANRFGLWLNGQLRKRSDKLVALGESEMRHFASKAILDVAWPIPLQRRAKAGAA